MSSRGPRRGSSRSPAGPVAGDGSPVRVRAPPRWCRHSAGAVLGLHRSGAVVPRCGSRATEVAPGPTVWCRCPPPGRVRCQPRVVQAPGPANRSWLLLRSIAHDPASRDVATATVASLLLRRTGASRSMRSGQRARCSSVTSPTDPGPEGLGGPRPGEPFGGGPPLSGQPGPGLAGRSGFPLPDPPSGARERFLMVRSVAPQ